MRLHTALAAGFGALMAVSAPAMAKEAKLYPYASKANYCPAGLQPVTMGGVICCGTPNQNVSYQSMMVHPTPKKRHVKRVRHVSHAVDCPIGVKGCR